MIQGADSEQWNITDKEYLPGRVLTVILGKARALVKEEITIGTLAN